MNKFRLVGELIKGETKVLDVGCRDCSLKKYVTGDYMGLDLFQNDNETVDIVASISDRIPLPDKFCTCSVALDLVEHLDGFSETLKELLRVSSNKTVIMLPNICHLLHRVRFLITGNLGGKYKLDMRSCTKFSDRHRWVTTLTDCDNFIHSFCRLYGYQYEKIYYVGDGKWLKLCARLAKIFHLPKSLYIWSMIYIINK